MSGNDDLQRDQAVRLMLDAVVTFAVSVLAWLAFDDITTDNSTDFTVEYTALTACAAWLFLLAVRLVWINQRALGITSLVFLAAALWGQRGIGPGPRRGLDSHGVALLAAFAWTLVLAVILFRRGWALHPERESHSTPG